MGDAVDAWYSAPQSTPTIITTLAPNSTAVAPKFAFLPPIGSRGYYALLGAVAILLVGPIVGIAAAYMNFSIGFFLSRQVLARILGSVVTFRYRAEGKHGANYIHTIAAAVRGLARLFT